ncbi:fused MFS/spermidine synthase [Romeriopsis navalis]|nr:fused MFS/spermidine synthase [Romeriopsis navalis]
MFKRDSAMVALKTDFQAVEYVETTAFGHALVLDGLMQSAELDEHLYHEALVHPAMFLHPCPKRVLIIGGGEGATLREVLKHNTVEAVTMVDIDGELVDFCKQNLHAWHAGTFDDPRLNLLHEDGRAFLENTHEQYDVILTDITDGLSDSPILALYTKEFYCLCHEHLTPQGVMSVQAFTLTIHRWQEHALIARTIAAAFPIARSYTAFIPSFLLTWGFVLATKTVDPLTVTAATIADRIIARGMEDKLRAYDQITHAAYFSLLRELRQNIARPGGIVEDGKAFSLDV